MRLIPWAGEVPIYYTTKDVRFLKYRVFDNAGGFSFYLSINKIIIPTTPRMVLTAPKRNLAVFSGIEKYKGKTAIQSIIKPIPTIFLCLYPSSIMVTR
jgi:hypothetical protein